MAEFLKILEIIQHQGVTVLILEDFPGRPLKKLIPEQGILVASFLERAVLLSEVLERIHQSHFIIGDFNPLTVLFDPETNKVRVCPPGLGPKTDSFIGREGTLRSLAYISPEQTGRIDRPVDYRTDLYSLGISFYEMLTGKVPFYSNDPLELLHAHIAQKAVPPEKLNSQIPQALSAVIMKLLSKEAEERYQNTTGLVADLRECLRQFQTLGRIDPFQPGRYDPSRPFILPRILVGRDPEIKMLQEALDRAEHGLVEVLMVSGEPGIGKSALVNQLRLPRFKKRSIFISGKYDLFRKELPYSAIIQAFQGLVRQLIAESEERIQIWKERLLWALNPNGKIITEVIPEVERIIGQQADIPELGPEENLNRFIFVFKNFVRIFACWEHPLVVFLDDLQWADPASLNLLEHVITDPDLRFFLFIGAYRDTEVPDRHPLRSFLEAIRNGQVATGTLPLGPINREDVNRLLSPVFDSPADNPSPLVEIVWTKTRGNPFFINQFLQTLYREGRILIGPAGNWVWNLEKIEELQVTENVVQFMARQLQDLPSEDLHLLQVGACIGNRFEAETLSILLALPLDRSLSILERLLKAGLINFMDGQYFFQHNRIQEAAYSLIPPEEQEKIHHQIGKLAYDQTLQEELFHRIFFIVDQMNRGRRLLSRPEDRHRLAELNLKAGIKAKDSTAYESAAAYFSIGIELLEENAWETDYSLAFSLYIEQMECQYLARNFSEARRLFECIIKKAASRRDKVRAYNAMVLILTNTGQPREAIRLGLEALKLFRIHIPYQVGRLPVRLALFKTKRQLMKITVEGILELPPMTDPDLLVLHDLLPNIGTPAYYVSPNLFALLTLKAVITILRHGLTPHAAVSFMALATILQTEGDDYETAFRLGLMSLKLNRKLGNRKTAGRVFHTFAFFIQHWKKHARYDLDFFSQAFESSLHNGDFLFAGHSITSSAQLRVWLSHNLDEILDELNRHWEFIGQVNDPMISAQYQQIYQFILGLKGKPPDRSLSKADSLDYPAYIDYLRKEDNLFGLCFALSPMVILHLWTGRYEEALQTALELEGYIDAPRGSLLVVDHYFNLSLVLIALLKEGETKRRRKFKAMIHRNLNKLSGWAALCPENFQHKLNLIQAEVAGLEGRFQEALSLFQAAIEGAERNGFLYEEALACERKGQLYLKSGNDAEAGALINLAYRCYERWGSTASMTYLISRYPDFFPKGEPAPPPDPSQPPNLSQEPFPLLDMNTVMRVSQALSGEIFLEQLLKKIMQIALINAGAQRGFLLLNSDGNLYIEACGEPEKEAIQVMQSLPLETSTDLSQAIIHYVNRSGEAIILGNAYREGSFIHDPFIRRNRCRSILCTPMVSQGRTIGILYLENNLTTHAFTPERLELLKLISTQAAVSLENARLFELATTDGLTKLYIQRYFHLLLGQEMHRSFRHSQPLSLIMMDIDNFKKINDTFGHPQGDEVLRQVARTIRNNCRTEDIPARYGGEEFVLLLPATNQDGALAAAEKIRRAVEAMAVPTGKGALQVTISLGVAVFPDQAENKESLIHLADQALYEAKRTGKNRVVLKKE
jgi:diguanylate cyclase (GGDEF)-like protein